MSNIQSILDVSLNNSALGGGWGHILYASYNKMYSINEILGKAEDDIYNIILTYIHAHIHTNKRVYMK